MRQYPNFVWQQLWYVKHISICLRYFLLSYLESPYLCSIFSQPFGVIFPGIVFYVDD